MSDKQLGIQVCGQVLMSTNSEGDGSWIIHIEVLLSRVKQTHQIVIILWCLFCVTHLYIDKQHYPYANKEQQFYWVVHKFKWGIHWMWKMAIKLEKQKPFEIPHLWRGLQSLSWISLIPRPYKNLHYWIVDCTPFLLLHLLYLHSFGISIFRKLIKILMCRCWHPLSHFPLDNSRRRQTSPLLWNTVFHYLVYLSCWQP